MAGSDTAKAAETTGGSVPDVQRDIKEIFEVGREDHEEMPNIWYPDGILPGFREACLDFYWVCGVGSRGVWKT